MEELVYQLAALLSLSSYGYVNFSRTPTREGSEWKVNVAALAESAKRARFLPLLLASISDSASCRVMGMAGTAFFASLIILFVRWELLQKHADIHVCTKLVFALTLIGAIAPFAARLCERFDPGIAPIVRFLFCFAFLIMAAVMIGDLYYLLFPAWLMHRVLQGGIAIFQLPERCLEVGVDCSAWLTAHRAVYFPPILDDENEQYANFYVYSWVTYVVQKTLLWLLAVVSLLIPGFLILGRLIEPAVYGFCNHLREFIGKSLADTRVETVKNAIVYLRYFGHDTELSSVGSYLNPIGLEEHFVRSLAAGGKRVVALGRPGEDLPPIGAERFYVEDAVWQETISKWLADSHAVVMIGALSEATGWELAEIFSLDISYRLLILFPFLPPSSKGPDDILRNRTVDEVRKFDSSVVGRILRIVPDATLPSLEPDEILVGITFDGSRVIAITSSKRDFDNLQEAIIYQMIRIRRSSRVDRRWRFGAVDRSSEHILVCTTSPSEIGFARLGQDTDGNLIVYVLRDSRKRVLALSELLSLYKELDCLMNSASNSDAWTLCLRNVTFRASNLNTKWRHRRPGKRTKPESSKLDSAISDSELRAAIVSKTRSHEYSLTTMDSRCEPEELEDAGNSGSSFNVVNVVRLAFKLLRENLTTASSVMLPTSLSFSMLVLAINLLTKYLPPPVFEGCDAACGFLACVLVATAFMACLRGAALAAVFTGAYETVALARFETLRRKWHFVALLFIWMWPMSISAIVAVCVHGNFELEIKAHSFSVGSVTWLSSMVVIWICFLGLNLSFCSFACERVGFANALVNSMKFLRRSWLSTNVFGSVFVCLILSLLGILQIPLLALQLLLGPSTLLGIIYSSVCFVPIGVLLVPLWFVCFALFYKTLLCEPARKR